MCAYLSSGPIVVMILEGINAIAQNRKLMGATDPKNAEDNTLRKLYGISIDKKFSSWFRLKTKRKKRN